MSIYIYIYIFLFFFSTKAGTKTGTLNSVISMTLFDVIIYLKTFSYISLNDETCVQLLLFVLLSRPRVQIYG